VSDLALSGEILALRGFLAWIKRTSRERIGESGIGYRKSHKTRHFKFTNERLSLETGRPEDLREVTFAEPFIRHNLIFLERRFIMKRESFVAVFVMIAVSVLLLADASIAIAIHWNVQYNSTLKVSNEFTDNDLTFGVIYLRQKRQKWSAVEYDDNKIWHYSGSYKFVDDRTRIQPNFNNSSRDEYKAMLTYWIKSYAKDEGVSIRNIRITIDTLKMSRPRVIARNPLKFTSITATCKGTARAIVNGKSRSRSFVHQSKIKILD
jgi:hypothetical protein